MKILVVDDDRFHLAALECALAKAGHVPALTTSGAGALKILREGQHRIVISDWEMPGMDGLELCRRIRSAGFPFYVYIILLTARDRSEDVVAGLSAGADEFVTKPFVPAELLARVRAGERLIGMETRDMTIYALAKLAESRDPETGAHLDRVRAYTRLLASLLHARGGEPIASEEFVDLIALTSPLHDIGKVGIPDSILLKAGPLTDAEFEIMKTHTTIGAQTIDAVAAQFNGVPFLQMAREIIIAHHERFDGLGYPFGISGGDIPLSARITAVADVYDALTSRRVYKEPFSEEYARSVLLSERGRHFDPQLVDLFLRHELEFISIHSRHPDPVRSKEAAELVPTA